MAENTKRDFELMTDPSTSGFTRWLTALGRASGFLPSVFEEADKRFDNAVKNMGKNMDKLMDDIEKRTATDLFGNIIEQLMNLPAEASIPIMKLKKASFEEIQSMMRGLEGTFRFVSASVSDIMTGRGFRGIGA